MVESQVWRAYRELEESKVGISGNSHSLLDRFRKDTVVSGELTLAELCSLAIADSLTMLPEEASNLERLTLRQARRIAGSLTPRIAQKVNGVDQKLDFLVGQIKQRYKEAPQEVGTVIAKVLQESKQAQAS